MLRLAVHQATTSKWGFEEAALEYARLGIPAIGVDRRKLAEIGEEKAGDLLEHVGLGVSSITAVGGFTGSDGRSYKLSVQDALGVIRWAGEVKAHCIIVNTGSRARHTFNHARRIVRDALRELIPAAVEAGVTIALEPMHPAAAGDVTFLTTLEETLEILSAVDHPRAKLVLDLFHCSGFLKEVDRLGELVPAIALVQVADAAQGSDRVPIRCRVDGENALVKEVLATLVSHGYQGFLEMEWEGSGLEPDQYPQVLQQAKDLFAVLVSKTEARSFLAE